MIILEYEDKIIPNIGLAHSEIINSSVLSVNTKNDFKGCRHDEDTNILKLFFDNNPVSADQAELQTIVDAY